MKKILFLVIHLIRKFLPVLCFFLSFLQKYTAVIPKFLPIFPYSVCSNEYSHCDTGLQIEVLSLQTGSFGLCKESCCLQHLSWMTYSNKMQVFKYYQYWYSDGIASRVFIRWSFIDGSSQVWERSKNIICNQNVSQML